MLQGKRQRLDITLGPNWRSLVLYSPNPAGTGLGSNIVGSAKAAGARGNANPAASNFICFEPMAGITDAMSYLSVDTGRQQKEADLKNVRKADAGAESTLPKGGNAVR